MAKKRLKKHTLESRRGGGVGAFFSRLIEQIKTPVGLGLSIGVLIIAGAIIVWLVSQSQQARAGGPLQSGDRPLAAVPPAERNGYYRDKGAPALVIDPTRAYTATISVVQGGKPLGDMVFRLYADKAPQTVNNFVFLARQGFYDGLTFHRVIEGFMAQGGDPSGAGTGGPGYTFPDEPSALALKFDRPGLLAMANSGANTNGSQFFVTYVPTVWLNGKHAIFGEIVSGQEVLTALTRRDPEAATTPGDVMQSVVITEGPALAPAATAAP